MNLLYKNTIIFLFLLVLSFVSYFRTDFGNNFDYLNYVDIFNNSLNPDFLDRSIEVGYLYLNSVFLSAGSGFDLFYFCLMAFCLYVKSIVALKLTQRTEIFILFYMCSFFLIHELVQLRTALGCSIIYIALLIRFSNAFVGLKIFFLCILCLVGYSLHKSVLLPVFLISIFHKKYFILVLVLFFIMAFDNNVILFVSNYLQSSGESYSSGYAFQLENSSDEFSVFSASNVIYFLILLFHVYILRCIEFNSLERLVILISIYFVVISFCLFYMFNNVPVFKYRFSELMRVLVPISSTIIVNRVISSNKVVGMLVLCLNVSLFIVYIKVV